MKSKTVKILLTINALLLGALGYKYLTKEQDKRNYANSVIDRGDARYAEEGVYRRGDYNRLMDLMDSTHKAHTISDNDLNWTIDLIRGTHRNDASSTALSARGWIGVLWTNLRQVSPDQSKKLTQAVIDQLLLPSTKDTDPIVSNSLVVLRRFGNPDALPLLHRYESSSEPSVKTLARKALRSMGQSKSQAERVRS